MTALAEPLTDVVYSSDIPHLPPGYLGVETFVEGVPAPQGSKSYGRNRKTGKVQAYESSPHLKQWRKQVTMTFMGLPVETRAQWPYQGAVTLGLEFVRPRPKSMPKSYTREASVQPDWDKLARAVGDGVDDAGVYANDGQMTTGYVHKRYAEIGERSGCRIVVIPAGLGFVLAINPDVLPRIAID